MMGGKKEEEKEEEKSLLSHKNKINLHYLPVGDQTKVELKYRMFNMDQRHFIYLNYCG